MAGRRDVNTNTDDVRRPARQDAVREHNLALVMGEIARASDPVSRADISASTGLTRATVSSLVDALLGIVLVRELEPSSGHKGGRPATGLVVNGAGGAGLGIEINVDYIAACVVDLRGDVRQR